MRHDIHIGFVTNRLICGRSGVCSTKNKMLVGGVWKCREKRHLVTCNQSRNSSCQLISGYIPQAEALLYGLGSGAFLTLPSQPDDLSCLTTFHLHLWCISCCDQRCGGDECLAIAGFLAAQENLRFAKTLSLTKPFLPQFLSSLITKLVFSTPKTPVVYFML